MTIATIEWFNCDHKHVMTGRIARRYPRGLTIVGPKDMVFYADTNHVLHDPGDGPPIEQPRGTPRQSELGV